MIQIVVLISELSYSSIAGKAIEEYADNNVLGKVGKAVTYVVPKHIKRNLAIKSMMHYEDKILKSLNEQLGNIGLPISLCSFNVETTKPTNIKNVLVTKVIQNLDGLPKTENPLLGIPLYKNPLFPQLHMELEMCFGLNEIDYAAIVPSIKKSFEKHEELGEAGLAFFDKAEANLPLERIVNTLPQDLKDDIVIGLLNMFGTEIVNAINTFAEEEGWKITIACVMARKLGNTQPAYFEE